MPRIIILGLGTGKKQLTQEARKAILHGRPLYLRTRKHPVASYLTGKGVRYRTFDYIYRRSPDFKSVYRRIARRIVRTALIQGCVYYAVPGHPSVGEETIVHIRKLARRLNIDIKEIPGVSFLGSAFSALGIDLLEGTTVIDALEISKIKEPSCHHLILAQVYNRPVASRVKLKLLEMYPPGFRVAIIHRTGMRGEKVIRLPLYALDRHEFDHYTSVYIPPAIHGGLKGLVEIMAGLRGPGGCPWDRRQDHFSLRQYLVEETYEVIAAIEKRDDELLQEELGDLLLQVVFHSQIAHEEGRFDLNQVIEGISQKLIRRHPQVFKDSPYYISRGMSWEEIKISEKGLSPGDRYWPGDGLPALLASYKVQKKAAELGFDWPDFKGAADKLAEEARELIDAYHKGVSGKIEEEFGDFLFAAVNAARFLKVNPEMALGKAVRKFISRFNHILNKVEESGRPINEFSLDELDRWWEEAKKIETKMSDRQESG